MGRNSESDVRAMLRQMGYSERTVEEIIKWYENSGLQAEKCGGRNLHSGNIGKQKSKR